jgi:hypothetical protein
MTLETFVAPEAFRPALIFAQFRYVILHTTLEVVATAVRTLLQREARLVVQNGDWLVFESRLPTPTLDSKEPALPDERSDTMSERLKGPPSLP